MKPQMHLAQPPAATKRKTEDARRLNMIHDSIPGRVMMEGCHPGIMKIRGK